MRIGLIDVDSRNFPNLVLVQTPDLSEFTPQELYDELCRRGWTGTLTKVETLQPAF